MIELCKNTKRMSLELRLRWVAQEFSEMDHIKVVGLDETYIPVFPNGWGQWADLVRANVPVAFDVIFGNEPSYMEGHNLHFPNVDYIILDSERVDMPISGTMVRENPLKHWEFLSGASRSFFCKKILISGTESCGKTTIVKALAKMFYSSYSLEVGRYYAERYLGSCEEAFSQEDFERIVMLQEEQDELARKTANKVSIHDTDALITNFYLEQYLDVTSTFIELFSQRQNYDLIILLKPDVKWVADGQRWLSDQAVREANHEVIKKMYQAYKPGTKIVEIGGNYHERLNAAYDLIKKEMEK
jgi:HTH-type transcriptional repressor of NAD biosynthesis genes